jgi:hypothetical protein
MLYLWCQIKFQSRIIEYAWCQTIFRSQKLAFLLIVVHTDITKVIYNELRKFFWQKVQHLWLTSVFIFTGKPTLSVVPIVRQHTEVRDPTPSPPQFRPTPPPTPSENGDISSGEEWRPERPRQRTARGKKELWY